MAKGIIYITTTSVNGLIKIGKTGSDQFENRMAILEQNGYWNVSGLRRYFAVEVEEYDEKEKLIHTMFNKSQVASSELFALDKELARSLLQAFGGRQIYPKLESEAQKLVLPSSQKTLPASKSADGVGKNRVVIPDGVYYFHRKVKAWGNRDVLATMRVKDGIIYVLKGSTICPVLGKGNTKSVLAVRSTAKIQDDLLSEDCKVSAPSSAGELVLGGACNGWQDWKTKSGEPISVFRIKK